MDRSEPARPPRQRARSLAAWALGLLVVLAYAAVPEGGGEHAESDGERDEPAEDAGRPEILSVSPNDPFVGSTISIAHTGDDERLMPFAGKLQLKVLARRPGQMVVEVPRYLPVGDTKIRLATVEPRSFSARRLHSKPFHIRVRTPNYRKVFRSLLGGAALVVLGVGFLARGVRESMGVHAARMLSRASRHRSVVFGLGALLGTVAQTTTGAAGVLAGLASSRVLPRVPAAIAFLGVPLGAAVAPLLVAGLVEPREGLLAVAIGVLWLVLAKERRVQALAGLLLGMGLVAYGLQVFRPGLEPFMSDAVLWSMAERLRADSLGELVFCAALGSLLVAALHGPAPLIVLMLGLTHATHQWDLRTLLALLSGTGLGAALGALITAPAAPETRALARLHLCLGALSTFLSLLSLDLWIFLAELVGGPLAAPLHWTERASLAEIGLRLSVGFGLCQGAVALALAPAVPAIARWLERRQDARPGGAPSSSEELRATLERVLGAQHTALERAVELALTGTRRHGYEAEQALAESRQVIESLLAGPVRELSAKERTHVLAGASFVTLQLQNSLDLLLRQTERMIDARLAEPEGASSDEAALPVDDSAWIRSLHQLVSEGLNAARSSLRQGGPLDLESARAREIRINRIEADARGRLLGGEAAAGLSESQLRVLQVVDALEVSGNQVYRLAEILYQPSHMDALSAF
jgi:hypothetical protein